ALLPSSQKTLSAPEIVFNFEANSRGPLARVPTLRRARYRTRRQARYRPAGLSFGRAVFAPAGRQTGFQVATASLPSLLTSLAWSHLQLEVLGVTVTPRLEAQHRDLAVDRLRQPQRYVVLMAGDDRVEVGRESLSNLAELG